MLLSILAACGGGEDGASVPIFPIAPPPAPVTYQATLTPTAGEVTVGKTLQLVVSMVDSQGRSVANPPTVFTSSDPTLATVANQDGAASTGAVTGVATGSVQITAKATAPDGTALTQQATVTVVAAPLTYKLVLANPTVNLQYGQPMTVSATVLASDGTDVTAAASGWSWSNSDTTVVGITPSGATASLLANNTSSTTPASATVTAQTTAPNGSTMSGQISATALPNYTYQTILSATSAKVAADRTVVITAKVLRSDGVDVTASSQTLNWAMPPSGSASLAMTLSNNNTTATFTSTRPDLDVEPSDPPVPDAGVQTNVTVQAGDSPPATFAVTEFAQYTNAVSGGPLNRPAATNFTISLKRFHSSADGSPEVTSECDFSLATPQPPGSALGIDPPGLIRLYFQSAGTYTLGFQSICTNNVPPHLWTFTFLIL
ncbi:hypothetical protein [Variovorax sp. GB1P17]|uniref:hypothetical protein n=1 Tax=Variovorax sp. GB1P17 TaxID=3443740 RepID=UPI003F48245A